MTIAITPSPAEGPFPSMPMKQQHQQQPPTEHSIVTSPPLPPQVRSRPHPTSGSQYRQPHQPRKKSKHTKSTVPQFHTLPQAEPDRQITEDQARLGPNFNFASSSNSALKPSVSHKSFALNYITPRNNQSTSMSIRWKR